MTGTALYFLLFPLIIVLQQWRSPSLISSVNIKCLGFWLNTGKWNARSKEKTKNLQPSVCDWLFSWTQSTDKDSKGGPSGKGLKKCAQQVPSVFSNRLLWPQPHFLNCQWLCGTIYTHQSQGLSYLFYLLFPLFLFVFVSFLTVRYLSSLPVL